MIYNIKREIDRTLRDAREGTIAAGGLPGFRPETAELREGDWSVTAPREAGTGPTHYLAGVQSASEAEAWCQSRPGGDGPVILWLDSVWGAFEVEEILFALKGGVAAVDCDLDGYLYSLIEIFRELPEFVLPDRADMTPGTHLLRSFTRLAAGVCRRRGVRFDAPVPDAPVSTGRVEAADLLLVPRGRITERGMRRSIRTVLDYLADRPDPAPADDAAVLRSFSAARLAAAQLWQWVRHETGVLAEGRIVTGALFEELLSDEMERRPEGDDCAGAAAALGDTVLSKSFTMHAFSEPPGGYAGN
jgi:hypothetical protein